MKRLSRQAAWRRSAGQAWTHPAFRAAGVWPVHADEPAQSARLPGPWRASDHDPVWVDLDLVP